MILETTQTEVQEKRDDDASCEYDRDQRMARLNNLRLNFIFAGITRLIMNDHTSLPLA